MRLIFKIWFRRFRFFLARLVYSLSTVFFHLAGMFRRLSYRLRSPVVLTAINPLDVGLMLAVFLGLTVLCGAYYLAKFLNGGR